MKEMAVGHMHNNFITVGQVDHRFQKDLEKIVVGQVDHRF